MYDITKIKIKNKGEKKKKEDIINVFTDGACSNNGRENAPKMTVSRDAELRYAGRVSCAPLPTMNAAVASVFEAVRAAGHAKTPDSGSHAVKATLSALRDPLPGGRAFVANDCAPPRNGDVEAAVHKLPVFTDHFPSALAEMSSATSRPDLQVLAIELQRALDASELQFWQNKGYVESMPRTFTDNYCSIKLPVKINPSAGELDVTVGIFLLGPNIEYPKHTHPAEEAYVVLSGEARWRRGREDWVTRTPGDYMWHAENVEHEMRTTDTPLLALWAWTGDIVSPSAWID